MSGPGIPQSDRDREIVRLYAEPGMSLQKVGDRVGLTRERVRQILNAHGVTARHIRARRLPVCRWCGDPIPGVGGSRRYHDDCRALALEARRERRRQEMVEQVREFVRVHGRTPGGVDFNPASHNVSDARRREALACRAVTPIPHTSHVQGLFGSTRALIDAAGVPPAEIGAVAVHAGRARRGEV